MTTATKSKTTKSERHLAVVPPAETATPPTQPETTPDAEAEQPSPQAQAEIAEAEINQVHFDWLVSAPVSDVNFTQTIKQANMATIAVALAQVLNTPNPGKTKVKVLKSRLKVLGGEVPEPAQPQPEPPQSEASTDTETEEEVKPKPSIPGFKFNLQQPKLAAALSSLKQICVRGKTPHPILSCILVDASDDKVTLTAFNLSQGLQITLDATVDVSGKFAMPAVLFTDLVTRLGDETLTITHRVDDFVVVIGSSVGKHEIKGMDADEFPALPEFQGDSFTLPQGALTTAIAHTAFSTSDDETKQVLTAAHLSINGEAFELASTDGHRLSVYTQTIAEGKLPELEINIPRAVLPDLRQLTAADTILNFRLDNSHRPNGELLEAAFIEVSTPNLVLVSRLIDGQYPNYNNLIPDKFKRRAVFNRVSLLAAMERVALFAENGVIKLEFDPKAKKCKLAAQFAEGLGDEDMKVDLTGFKEPFLIAFNSTYLIQALRVLATEECTLNMNENCSPVLFFSDQFKHLLMPVQVRQG